MTLATEESVQYLGETRGCADHDHDLENVRRLKQLIREEIGKDCF